MDAQSLKIADLATAYLDEYEAQQVAASASTRRKAAEAKVPFTLSNTVVIDREGKKIGVTITGSRGRLGYSYTITEVL